MAYILIIFGLVVMFFGVLGIIILPDFLLRIHASTKCGVTGAVSIMIGFAVYSGKLDIIIKILLIVIFLFFTSPLVAHLLGVYHLSRTSGKK